MLYPFIGAKAFFVLVFALLGLLLGAVYAGVGRKVTALRRKAAAEGLEAIPARTVNSALQYPGTIVLDKNALHLHGIVSEPVTLNWSEISAYRDVRWFNGTLLFGKTGFWFTLKGKTRLDVALPDSAAVVLREHLPRSSPPAAAR
jgi:hypothetical protein